MASRKEEIEARRAEYAEIRGILFDILRHDGDAACRLKAAEMIFEFDDLDRQNVDPYTQATKAKEIEKWLYEHR